MTEPTPHHDEPADVRRERLARAFAPAPARTKGPSLAPVLAGLGLAALIALIVGLVGAVRAPDPARPATSALRGPSPVPAYSPPPRSARQDAGNTSARRPNAGAGSGAERPDLDPESSPAAEAPAPEPEFLAAPLTATEEEAAVEEGSAFASEEGTPFRLSALALCAPAAEAGSSESALSEEPSAGALDELIAVLATLAGSYPATPGEGEAAGAEGPSTLAEQAAALGIECPEPDSEYAAPAQSGGEGRAARTADSARPEAVPARTRASRRERTGRRRAPVARERAVRRRAAARAERRARPARPRTARRQSERAPRRSAPRRRKRPPTPAGGTPLDPSSTVDSWGR